jgi:hypothetical protein
VGFFDLPVVRQSPVRRCGSFNYLSFLRQSSIID